MADYLLMYTIADGRNAGQKMYLWFYGEKGLKDFVERNKNDIFVDEAIHVLDSEEVEL